MAKGKDPVEEVTEELVGGARFRRSPRARARALVSALTRTSSFAADCYTMLHMQTTGSMRLWWCGQELLDHPLP